MSKVITYIINLPKRVERKREIQNEFLNKKEFEIHIFPAFEEKRGAWGLWKSIISIVRQAKKDDLDAVLICEDDHRFTYSYNWEDLNQDLHIAANLGCQILLGGIGNFQNMIPISNRLMWVDTFWCTQFMILFNNAFDVILNAKFNPEKDVADEFLSCLLSNKLVIYPFISVQRETGYSDVTNSNNSQGAITRHFEKTNIKIEHYLRIYKKYKINCQFGTNSFKQYPQWEYLKTTLVPKLHIGCGPFIKPNWLNVDVCPRKGVEFMDASKEFPFPNESFQYIFSEHMLEHLDYLGGRNFFSESFRILKKGGILRLAVPNLDFLIQLYVKPDDRINRNYINWSISQYNESVEDDFINQSIPPGLTINYFMHEWGHKMIYDKDLLLVMLQHAGFQEVSFCEIGKSSYPELTDLEDHGNMIPDWANQLETMVVEAKRK